MPTATHLKNKIGLALSRAQVFSSYYELVWPKCLRRAMSYCDSQARAFQNTEALNAISGHLFKCGSGIELNLAYYYITIK